jgi:hypothetical protein
MLESSLLPLEMMDLGSNKNIQKKNKLMTFSPLFNGPRVFIGVIVILSGYYPLISLLYRKLCTVYRTLLRYLARKGTLLFTVYYRTIIIEISTRYPLHFH